VQRRLPIVRQWGQTTPERDATSTSLAVKKKITKTVTSPITLIYLGVAALLVIVDPEVGYFL